MKVLKQADIPKYFQRRPPPATTKLGVEVRKLMSQKQEKAAEVKPPDLPPVFDEPTKSLSPYHVSFTRNDEGFIKGVYIAGQDGTEWIADVKRDENGHVTGMTLMPFTE